MRRREPTNNIEKCQSVMMLWHLSHGHTSQTGIVNDIVGKINGCHVMDTVRDGVGHSRDGVMGTEIINT